MLRAYLVLSLVAVLFGAFVLAGCTDSNSPLPPLRAVDVTGLLIGPSGMILPILPVGEALPAVPRGVSLDELMEAYAHSQETDWEGDTTPQLSVVLLLEDGRIVVLHFTGEYPVDCAVVAVYPALGSETPSDTWSVYRVKSPGLERAVRELAQELGMPQEN